MGSFEPQNPLFGQMKPGASVRKSVLFSPDKL